MTHENHTDAPVAPIPPDSGPEPEKNTRSEARRGVFSAAVDPEDLPRPKRRVLLPVLAVLMLVGVGRAAWPVIDISAVAQLVEAVRLAQDQLTEVTTAKQALLGQVANYTGIWDDLTGDAYELGEQASGIVSTARSLTDIRSDLVTRRNAETNAWPTLSDVQTAYAGADASVVTQVLSAHQTNTQKWNEQRAAWYDSQIMLASTGEFLEAVEATASTQNSTTDSGLSAQLDRQIAVSSSARDIAARQLEVSATSEYRVAQLDHQQALDQARRQQQELRIRGEILTSIQNHQAGFDEAAFDSSLFTPVLPSYKSNPNPNP